jgi:predicted anti-sigma-YlaC factor YlaD
MPTCREMSELATDYMEGALGWRARFAAWRHLRACAMCRAYYDQLAKLQRLLRGGELPPPAADVEQALLAARPHEGPAG